MRILPAFLLSLSALSCGMKEFKHTNALIHEASPYLLQHAHNPVNWQPWSDKAFEQAARENKPVFLSIGYAACHWCHVMEHESFENDSIAEFLNRNFISIKVDREERPDIDHHYMQAVQMMTGQGGWPMSVFLTADRKPFYGGTYWPPKARYGRPGFLEVLRSIQQAWTDKRERIDSSAAELHTMLSNRADVATSGELSDSLLDGIVSKAEEDYDSVWGGFGGAPKFPQAMELAMLFREQHRTGNERAKEMVIHSLEMIVRGGINDHIGGGFHRYSTDEKWLVPHFEKMLYDNALLIPLCLDAYAITGDVFFRTVAVECLEWALREMEMTEGGFASSLDADSEGEEGKFYVWTPEEIIRILGKERGERFCSVYGINSGGNFEHGTSIPNLIDSGKNAGATYEEDRAKLLQAREARVRPARDDKVLTDWNGLFLSALVRGYEISGNELYLASAIRTGERLIKPFQENGRLVHSFLGDRTQNSQLLLDYAALGNGLLDLFWATGDIDWFNYSVSLTKTMDSLFSKGDELYSMSEAGVAGTRIVDFYDNATPSGNSMAGNLLARLYALTGDEWYRTRAEQQVKPLVQYLERAAPAFSQAMFTVDLLINPPSQIILVGDADREFWDIAVKKYLPHTEILWVQPELMSGLTENSPLYSLLSGKEAINHKPTAYICQNFVCNFPITDAEELEDALTNAAVSQK